MLVGALQTIDLACTAQEASAIHNKWTQWSKASLPVGEICFSIANAPRVLSPTQDFTCVEATRASSIVAIAQADFEKTIELLIELGVQSVLERLSVVWSPYQWTFILCVPDLGISFACTVGTFQRPVLCAAIQSLPSNIRICVGNRVSAVTSWCFPCLPLSSSLTSSGASLSFWALLPRHAYGHANCQPVELVTSPL